MCLFVADRSERTNYAVIKSAFATDGDRRTAKGVLAAGQPPVESGIAIGSPAADPPEGETYEPVSSYQTLPSANSSFLWTRHLTKNSPCDARESNGDAESEDYDDVGPSGLADQTVLRVVIAPNGDAVIERRRAIVAADPMAFPVARSLPRENRYLPGFVLLFLFPSTSVARLHLAVFRGSLFSKLYFSRTRELRMSSIDGRNRVDSRKLQFERTFIQLTRNILGSYYQRRGSRDSRSE